jgi:hypothetical protein
VPTLGTLAAGVKSVATTRRSEVYITELDENDRPLVSGGFPQWRKFQYYPESIADTKQVSYQPKEVPGGSLPLYQWTGSGERTISFTAVFTTDVDHLSMQSGIEIPNLPISASLVNQSFARGEAVLPSGAAEFLRSVDAAVQETYDRLQASGVKDRNPYIPGALLWLRRFMLPRYGENAEVGVPITRPPRKLMLNMPGTDIELFGGAGGFSQRGGGILCVMTTCDINIEALFPSGNIRIATVSLAFAEVPQRGGSVRFPSAAGLDEHLSLLALTTSGRFGGGG